MKPAPHSPLVLGLSIAQLISWGSTIYAFSVLVGPIEQALGASRAQSSLAFSLGLLVQGLAAFRIGRLIDRGHERVVMTGGSALVALGLIAQAFARSVVLFDFTWIVLGLGIAATLYTPVFAVVTRRFPRDYRQQIIVITFAGGLASTVFIPLTYALIQQWGWRVACGALGAANLLVCVPLHAVLLRHAPAAVPAEAGGRAATPGRASRYFGQPVFLRLGAFIVLLMAVTAAVPPHLVNLLRESALPAGWAIMIPAAIGVLQVLGRIVLYVGDRRFDVHRTNHWVPVLIPLALLMLLAGRGWWLAALLFALLYGVGNGMFTIVRGTVIAQYVSIEHVGALNGALGLPMALARAAAPLAVGLLWSPERGYAWGLALLLALALVAVFMLWSAQRRASRAAASRA